MPGPTGPTGATGPQGPAGATGATGTPGAPGVNSLATTSANGLLKQVSGSTNDFVDGTNNCQTLLPIQVSKLTQISTNLGVVSTNQTVDCTGACSVFVNLNYSAAMTLNLTKLGQGAQVFLRVTNSAGAAATIKIAGTGPTGTALAVVKAVFVSQGPESDLIVTGVSLSNGTTQYFQGMCFAGTSLYLMGL